MSNADRQRFLEAYERVRREEAWGGDDLDLPFHPKRHRAIWAIRQRTFRTFERLATHMMRGIALDVGAGNCWMTRYLSAWGFQAIAIDINVGEADGLAAGQTFIRGGARFSRVCAAMDRLPFAAGRVGLVVANASFHYAQDLREALQEFVRVLRPAGTIAIIDTPVYERAADGERMLADRVVEWQHRYGMTEAAARWSRYLTFADIAKLATVLGLSYQIVQVWPGLRRTYQDWRARALGRRIAQFPIVVLTKP